MTGPDLEQEIDRLYSLPLAEFIGERNGLAKSLRSGGDRQAADEVKALAKPSVTAWAVNALYHHERQRFEALLEAATAVRAALAGEGDRRKAEAARRKALQALLGKAAKILAKAGHAATPANRQRMSHTLETLAARDPTIDGPRPGRLTADLEPQGFDVLAGLAASLAPTGPEARATKTRTGKRPAKPPPGKPPGKAGRATAASPAEPDKRLPAARREVEEQKAALAELEREADAAEAAAAEARDRHERLTEEAVETERLARAAAKALAAAKTDLAAANKAATRAKTAKRGARSRLATARRRLEHLEG